MNISDEAKKLLLSLHSGLGKCGDYHTFLDRRFGKKQKVLSNIKILKDAKLITTHKSNGCPNNNDSFVATDGSEPWIFLTDAGIAFAIENKSN